MYIYIYICMSSCSASGAPACIDRADVGARPPKLQEYVLYYIILYNTIQYYTILYNTILY